MKNRREIAVALAAGALLCLLPFLLGEFLLSLSLSCLMYVTLAVSWAMFSGATRYVSLGTSAFYGLGAYVCAWSVATLPWPVVIVCGALTAAGFAALAGGAILHLRGTYFAVLTFGLGELVRHSVTYAEKQYAGTVGRVLVEVPTQRMLYFTVLAITLAAVLTAIAVKSGRFGLALAGIGADEQRAETLGVSTRRVKIAGFALSAAFAGAIGAAMAVRLTYVDPPAVFNPFIGFQTVLIAMVGGAAGWAGPALAAIAFSLLAEFLRLEFPYVYMIILGVLLVATVIWLPQGLAGLWQRQASAR